VADGGAASNSQAGQNNSKFPKRLARTRARKRGRGAGEQARPKWKECLRVMLWPRVGAGEQKKKLQQADFRPESQQLPFTQDAAHFSPYEVSIGGVDFFPGLMLGPPYSQQLTASETLGAFAAGGLARPIKLCPDPRVARNFARLGVGCFPRDGPIAGGSQGGGVVSGNLSILSGRANPRGSGISRFFRSNAEWRRKRGSGCRAAQLFRQSAHCAFFRRTSLRPRPGLPAPQFFILRSNLSGPAGSCFRSLRKERSGQRRQEKKPSQRPGKPWAGTLPQ